MTKILRLALLPVLALLAVGCTDYVDEVDQGGVLLEVEFANSTFRVGVNDTDIVTLDTVNIDSVIQRPGGGSSSLMDVQLNTIEITYSRADTGTTVPPPLVYNVVGSVPAGGTLTYTALPILSIDQLRRPPLSDLLFQNGATDRETGSSLVKMNVTIRVYGRTIGGENVASLPRSQTFEFVPTLGTVF